MKKREVANYALICGLLRDELEFRITVAQVVEARNDGLFDGIVVSSWFGEIDAIPGLRETLTRLGVALVESYPPKVKVIGNAWAQHKAMLAGLRVIPDDAAVWRIRTDRTAHLLKAFRPCLEAGPSPCRQAGSIAPIFECRIAAIAIVATVPFYAADFAFYGLKQDLLKMIHFDGVYDSLYRGFGAETRLWTQPFLKEFPQLGDLYERVNIIGLSAHIVRAASEGRSIPEYILYFLTFYWLQLYNNIQLIEERTTEPLGLTVLGALGGEPCGAIRVGAVASHFTVNAVASHFTVNIALFNSQAALDRLIEGGFEDHSQLGVQYRRILDEIRAQGVDALPSWGEEPEEQLKQLQAAVPEVELMYYQSQVLWPDASARADEGSVDVLSGEHFRLMLARESQANFVDDETLSMVREKLALTKNGFDTGKIYNMIATEIFQTACDDRSKKLLGGSFLLRAAERGNVEAASSYGWLVYSGRLEVDTREHAIQWIGVAAVKENPLAQYTASLMCKNGWYGEERRNEADKWYDKALQNGFTPAMLSVG